MRYLVALLCALAFLSVAPEARAERRVALVIGNAAYQNTAELINPSHDASDMAAALKRLGFEVVEGRDLDKRSMERAIRQFGIKLAGADLALFFYAGHGLQVGGQNYLVPTDARLGSEGDVDFEGLPLSLVLKQMEREAKTSLVLLDACRDNPLSRNLSRSMGTRSVQVGQGLAEVRTGVGTLIGFSTQPGNVALDGAQRNSPYTEALLKHLEVPGQDVSAVLVAVRNDVLKTTAGRQVPWEHTSLTGQVYLSGGGTSPAVAGAGTARAAPALDYDRETELAFWNSVKDSKSVAVIETYLERFPNGSFAGLARVMIAQLKGEPASAAGDSTKIASAPSSASAAGTQAPSPTGGDPQALARSLQKELKRVGCDPGTADGQWGDKAKDALAEFSRRAKLSLSPNEPTAAALDAVSARHERVCPLSCGKHEAEINGRCVAKAAEKERPAHKPQRETVRESAPRERPAAPAPAREAPAQRCWVQDGRAFSLGKCP